MAKVNFEKALSLVLVHEGGFSNHPQDPGGATMKGITQKVYDEFRVLKNLEPRSVELISETELQAIYRKQYWDRARCDDLPEGVDYAVFDFAVNSGVSRSVKEFQRVLNVTPDGSVGNETLTAVKARADTDIINGLCDRRLAFLKGLKTWKTFGKGWERRVRDVRAQGIFLAEGEDLLEAQLPEAVPETASAKAPEASQAKLKTAEGAGLTIAGTAAAGQTLMATAEQVKPQINDSLIGRLALVVFMVLLLIGAVLIGYSYLKRLNERGGLKGLFG